MSEYGSAHGWRDKYRRREDVMALGWPNKYVAAKRERCAPRALSSRQPAGGADCVPFESCDFPASNVWKAADLQKAQVCATASLTREHLSWNRS